MSDHDKIRRVAKKVIEPAEWNQFLCFPCDHVVVCPTMAEFADMKNFVLRDLVNKGVEQYGIVKIKPPKECFSVPGTTPFEFSTVEGIAHFGNVLGDATRAKCVFSQSAVPMKFGGGAYDLFNTPAMENVTLSELLFEARVRSASEPFARDAAVASSSFWAAVGGVGWKERPPLYALDVEGSVFKLHPPESKLWNLTNLTDDYLGITALEEFADNANDRVVPGVHTPYLYMGTAMSAFAAHVEDRNLFSINYHHGGAAKIWYAIYLEDVWKFEKLAKDLLVAGMAKNSASRNCQDVLRHKTATFSPDFLSRHDIRFSMIVQEPGDYVITYPRGYHFGFNLGANLNEARNFTYESHLGWMMQASVCTCWPRKTSVVYQKRPVAFSVVPFVIKSLPVEEAKKYVKGTCDPYPGFREDGALPATHYKPSREDLEAVANRPPWLQAKLDKLPRKKKLRSEQPDTGDSDDVQIIEPQDNSIISFTVDDYKKVVSAQTGEEAEKMRQEKDAALAAEMEEEKRQRDSEIEEVPHVPGRTGGENVVPMEFVSATLQDGPPGELVSVYVPLSTTIGEIDDRPPPTPVLVIKHANPDAGAHASEAAAIHPPLPQDNVMFEDLFVAPTSEMLPELVIDESYSGPHYSDAVGAEQHSAGAAEISEGAGVNVSDSSSYTPGGEAEVTEGQESAAPVHVDDDNASVEKKH